MLSEETRAKIQERVAAYPKRRTALLPSLKLAQDELGYLPPEAVAEVADLVGVSHAAAQELTTFYSMLRTEPGGTLRVEVCVQLPCAVAGGERLLRQLASGLGIAPGETTPNGQVTLIRTAECLGGCHRAPMCRLNSEYVENLQTAEAVEQLIHRLQSQPLPTRPGEEHAA
jgi:NADH-quinone oxidoreductase subunit E